MSIVGYWRLNGNANDASGNGFNGSGTNISYTQSNGIINGGAGFNGTSSYIVSSANSILNLEGYSGSSVIACFNLHATPAAGKWAYIVKKGDYDALKSMWFLRINASLKLEFATTYNIDAQYDFFLSDQSIELNKWYVIVVRYNKSARTCEVYLNGNLFAITTYTAGASVPNSNTVALYFGYHTRTDVYYYSNISIDNVIINSTQISVAESKNQYSRIKGFF